MDFQGYDPGCVAYAQDLSFPYDQIDSTWKLPTYNFSASASNTWGSWNGNVAEQAFFSRPWDGFWVAIVPKDTRTTTPRGYRLELALTDAGRNLYQTIWDTGIQPAGQYQNSPRTTWNFVPLVVDPGSFTNLSVRGMEQTSGNSHGFHFMIRPVFRSLSDVKQANLASSWKFVWAFDGTGMKSTQSFSSNNAVSGNYSAWVECERLTKPLSFFEFHSGNNNTTQTGTTDPVMIEVGMGEAGSEVTVLRFPTTFTQDSSNSSGNMGPKPCQIPAGERVSFRYVTTQSSHAALDYNVRLWHT